MRLKDKVAIITGASRGIGKAIAELFSAHGAKLVLTAKNNIESLRSSSVDSLVLQVDLSNEKDLDNLVSKALEEFKRIDILVNSAGTFQQVDFESISKQALDETINVNFKGPFLLLQKVLPIMKEQRSGKVVNIVSGAGKMGSSKASHYASAKAGVITLTKSLAKKYGDSNININAIAPGFIETDMIKDMLANHRETIEKIIPLGRVGEAKDVANLALFLSSAQSSYITGQTICVDGGHCTAY